MPTTSMLSPLRHVAFRWLVAARVGNRFGNSIAPVALAFAVLDVSGSVVDLGIVVGARSIATVVLLLFGGVLADRLPRGLILQGSSAAAALTQALIAAIVLGHFATIPLLIVLSTLNGCVAAVSIPATLAMTSQTVPADMLRPANAITRMGETTGSIVGASTGGLIAGVFGPGWALAVTALVFGLTSVAYFGMRGHVAPPATRAEVSRSLTELREGWAEFRSRTWVWAVVLQFMIVNAALVGGMQVLGPAIADSTIGRPAWGLVLGIGAAGSFVGALIAARWHPRRALLVGVTVIFFEAVPLIALAEAPQLPVLIGVAFLWGLVTEQFGIAWDTSIQTHIPEDKLARVYSYDAIGSIVAIPTGEIAVGPIAQSVGTDTTLLGAAALIILATAAALTSRDIRTLTNTPPTP